MADFKILTDSCGDLSPALITQLELDVFPMFFHLGGKDYQNYPDDRELSNRVFYDNLRDGQVATTVAVNPAQWSELARPHLEAGKDILILAFSSGLSTTYQSACLAAEELREEFPDRNIEVVDSLCASMGEGLFCYHVARKRQSGATLEETKEYALSIRLKLCHWFTVDDLYFLKRGGRVSSTAALVGTMLQIKPVLHVDDEGHLIPVTKVRGRKAALNQLVKEMEATATDPENQTVFISHGDCIEDAQYVKKLIQEKLGTRNIILNPIGPVIGAHSGPGTVALFFLGSKR